MLPLANHFPLLLYVSPVVQAWNQNQNLLKIFQGGMHTSFHLYISFLDEFRYMHTIYLERIKKTECRLCKLINSLF